MGPTGKVRWTEGMQFVAEGGSGHAIVLDADAPSGGRNTGTRPLELVLLGLAGCTGVDVAFILRKMRKTFNGLEVEVESERAETHPRVFTTLRVVYRVRGVDVRERDLRKAIRLSETTYCSASAMLRQTARIESRFELFDHATGALLAEGVAVHGDEAAGDQPGDEG